MLIRILTEQNKSVNNFVDSIKYHFGLYTQICNTFICFCKQWVGISNLCTRNLLAVSQNLTVYSQNLLQFPNRISLKNHSLWIKLVLFQLIVTLELFPLFVCDFGTFMCLFHVRNLCKQDNFFLYPSFSSWIFFCYLLFDLTYFLLFKFIFLLFLLLLLFFLNFQFGASFSFYSWISFFLAALSFSCFGY